MRICRFCDEKIGDHEKICGNCGYNPQTDTMTTSFVRKNKKVGAGGKQKILNSGVKSFAFWGMIIIIFSLGIKYQGKIGDIIWKARNKSSPVSRKANRYKTTKLIDVRSYKAPADKSQGKNRKIEGIFYDPQGKSYVMINGQLISEKESFGNMVIKRINNDSVEVVLDGKEKILKVNNLIAEQ